MAEFHTRKGIVFHLDRIIDEADEELVLISPYIKADSDTKELLKDKTRRTKIRVVYGKEALNLTEEKFFDDLGIKTSFLKNLHAKCYLNENEALLTSMNLYKFSQQHNDEMGVLVSKENDPDLYKAIYEQAKRWIGDDTRESPKPSRGRKTRKKPRRTVKVPEAGFCIRCGDAIPADAVLPYCDRDFRSWNRYKNAEYEEEFCHTCGKEHETTMLQPVCPACYRKHKDWVDSTKK